MANWNNLTKGFFKENPVFVLLLGCCPTLATTTSAINGLSMGLATTFVLILSNMCISLLKNFIPNKRDEVIKNLRGSTQIPKKSALEYL